VCNPFTFRISIASLLFTTLALAGERRPFNDSSNRGMLTAAIDLIISF
jgi:hypothetical protein